MYEAGDGRYVTLAALEEPFWRAFCEAANRPDLTDMHGTTDLDERAVLRDALTDLFAEAIADEGFRDRGIVYDGRGDGTVSETDETVPDLGEHIESVLSEVGFDLDRLA